MESNITLPPDPARVMEGLRDTGYSFNTAVADIIDNSIAADAENISVLLNMDPAGAVTLYIGDDGYGMDYDGLINAMRYGSAVRENPSSLGKFGLGLKTASTAFCRCLSVISRGEDMETRKVQWDLDHIAQTGEWDLLQLDVTADEQEYFDEITDNGKGTLVIWNKIDRLITAKQKAARQKKYNNILESLEFHISMVYQRFLDKNDDRERNVRITLNGKNVGPWDPFCLTEPNTEILYEDNIEAVTAEDDPEAVATMHIKAVMIPRKDEFSSPEAEKQARLSNDRQGFYVYRENRLIHYGDWMGMYSKEPHGSLLRVELSFDHRLDDAFHVDIKKSRIILDENIFDHIKDQVLPGPRRAAEERYRKGKVKKVEEETEKAGVHEVASANIEGKADNLEESKVEVKNEQTGDVEVTNKNGTFEHTITIRHSDKPERCRVVPVDSLEDGVLWEPTIVDGKKAVAINMSHPYYQKVYYPVIGESVMITGMDALLWALAEAELSTCNDNTKDQYEDMRYVVSRNLRQLVSDLPDPKTDDEDEE